MPVLNTVKKITTNKYVIASIILILLVLVFIFIKRREGIKSKGKKRRNKLKLKRRERVREKRKSKNSSESDEEIDMTPKELYKQVHEDMMNGMSASDFAEAANNYNNKALYIELRQLYNSAKDNDQEVTVSDYTKLFTKLDLN